MNIRTGELQGSVIYDLLNFIKEGDFQEGDRLPSERVMAEILGISRNTLRQSTSVLQTLEIIEIRRGSGMYVKKADFFLDKDNPHWLAQHQTEVFDMLVVRECLENKALELIPKEDYPEVLDKLKKCIGKVDILQCTYDDLLAHDLEFHNIIRRASKNNLLFNLCAEITGTIYDERTVLFSKSDQIIRSLSEHNTIIDAFETGDLEKIKQSSTNHFLSTRRAVETMIQSSMLDDAQQKEDF